MDKIGPITRGVEDCAAVLAAIRGPDGRDLSVEDVPFNWTADTGIEKMRVGYLKEEFELRTGKLKKIYDEASRCCPGLARASNLYSFRSAPLPVR